MLAVLKGLCSREEGVRVASISQLCGFLAGQSCQTIQRILLEQLIHDPCPSIRLVSGLERSPLSLTPAAV